MAVIGTASNAITVYNLERKPKFVKNVIPPLKGQLQCLAIFRDKQNQYPNGKLFEKIKDLLVIYFISIAYFFLFFRFCFGKCRRPSRYSLFTT